MEPADVTAPPKIKSNLSSEKAVSAKASAARTLAQMFANSKGHGGYRRYLLERIDGELFFRQTESNAAVEAALAEVFSSRPKTSSRRIIKLPQT